MKKKGDVLFHCLHDISMQLKENKVKPAGKNLLSQQTVPYNWVKENNKMLY